MEKTCKACGEAKPLTDFHKDRSKADGLNSYCKPCTIAKQKVFQARPPKRADPPGLKTCQKCKEVKLVSEFWANAGTYDGLQKLCKVCAYEKHDSYRRKNLDKMAGYSKKWRDANPELAKDHKRKSTYGLNLGDYEKMLEAQGGKCAICESPEPGGRGALHVDHCHDTKAVRGLLCHGCNVGIGNLRHSKELLRRAITYLDQVKAVV